MEKTDEKVLGYLKQIEAAELEIKKANKPHWVTTCIINFDGKTINFNVLDFNGVLDLTTKLIQLKESSKLASNFLGIDESPLEINGFLLDDILTDLKTRMSVVTLKDKKSKLASFKKNLESKLSKDKSNEIEVDKLGGELGNLLGL